MVLPTLGVASWMSSNASQIRGRREQFIQPSVTSTPCFSRRRAAPKYSTGQKFPGIREHLDPHQERIRSGPRLAN